MKRSLASAGFAFLMVMAVLFGLSDPMDAQALTMTTVSQTSMPATSVSTTKGVLPKAKIYFKVKPKANPKPIIIEDIKIKEARKVQRAKASAAKAKKVVVQKTKVSYKTKALVKQKQKQNKVKVSYGAKSGRNWATPGQCTWGAQIKWHAATGSYLGGFIGNAYTWGYRAAAAGYSVGTTPRTRSVVVFAPGVAGAGSVGHVAWVTGVSGNKVTIVEMNGSSGPFNWDVRTVSHQRGMQYIYA